MKTLLALFVILCLVPVSGARADQSCVNIYFDRVTSDYWMGRTFSIFAQNLMGHFPKYQQIVSPIEKYRAGDIEKCHATIYIGSNFNAQIPDVFIADYVHTRKNVAWLGYNIWKLGDDLKAIFGHEYENLTTLDMANRDSKGHPSYFREILYKGEVFKKFGDWDKTNPEKFLAPFEQIRLKPVDQGRAQVLATARHSKTGEVIPYILRAANHFYVADIPFSFMHEGDRYLVFADLLFDILNEQPRHSAKYAFIRVEDIHALTPLGYNYRILNVLREEHVPINISLIPIFFDPLMRLVSNRDERLVPMNRRPQFMEFVNDLKSSGANFIWHGVTHQYKSARNPYDGTSGNDFEFFDASRGQPVVEDGVPFVLDRLNDGWYTLKQSGIAPRMWLTPHYQASALDYIIFANVFPWNVGRVIYFNHYASGLRSTVAQSQLWYGSPAPDADRLRREAFQSIRINYEDTRWNGQFFPFEIFGDIYGQRLVPENLGNSQPYISEHVVRYRTAADIVADAKRNLVIRDAWASLFYHPFLLEAHSENGEGAYPGDPAELKYIVQNLKSLGYQFVDINKFLDDNMNNMRPEPIYKELEP